MGRIPIFEGPDASLSGGTPSPSRDCFIENGSVLITGRRLFSSIYRLAPLALMGPNPSTRNTNFTNALLAVPCGPPAAQHLLPPHIPRSWPKGRWGKTKIACYARPLVTCSLLSTSARLIFDGRHRELTEPRSPLLGRCGTKGFPWKTWAYNGTASLI
jgi:hypothetical protein